MPRGIYSKGNKGLFKKGHKPWNTGKKRPEITGEKHPMWGKKLSEDICKQMSIKMLEVYKRKNTDGTKIGFQKENKLGLGNKNMLGKKHTEATKTLQSLAHKGKIPLNILRGELQNKKENNPMWKGGITPISSLIRHSQEYKDWRTAVFKRDNYTCVLCKSNGYKLNADHIKPFAYFPELRLVIENGRTLCVPCHEKTDSYGGKAYKYNIKENATL